MPAVRKRWVLLPHDANAVRKLAESAEVAPLVAQLLLNRHITDAVAAKRFLSATLTGLHPPTDLPGVPEAVERLVRAIEAGKKIVIYGDYDVDGCTGTAILYGLLKRANANVDYYVPHRLEEGYGVNAQALAEIAEQGGQVVVTVDCGIASIDEAIEARRLGLEFIITDHHEMRPTLPAADVLIHPRLPATHYPFGDLSGAGVAFKLAWALATRLSGSEKVKPEFRGFLLDAVAFATLGLVADVVPLHDENRILVKHGLARLTDAPPLGMKALLEAAKVGEKGVRAEDIAFQLAPRMNAAGRLGCARLVVEMLTTLLPAKAREVATVLEDQNVQRRSIERTMTQQAKELLDTLGCANDAGIVLSHPEWHPGVIGIVAGRMVEHTGRPVLMIAFRPDGIGAGSGRSIPGFALHEALQACDAALLGHGGHAMAAGLKVMPEKIPELRELFRTYATAHFPAGTPPAPRLVLDAELPLGTLSTKLVASIDELEPYGAANPRPKFLAGDVTRVGPVKMLGTSGRHIAFQVRQAGVTMRAVGFGMGDRLDELPGEGEPMSIAFVPKINEFRGFRTVELHLDDFRAGNAFT